MESEVWLLCWWVCTDLSEVIGFVQPAPQLWHQHYLIHLEQLPQLWTKLKFNWTLYTQTFMAMARWQEMTETEPGSHLFFSRLNLQPLTAAMINAPPEEICLVIPTFMCDK